MGRAAEMAGLAFKGRQLHRALVRCALEQSIEFYALNAMADLRV